jgi:hypothetical protein
MRHDCKVWNPNFSVTNPTFSAKFAEMGMKHELRQRLPREDGWEEMGGLGQRLHGIADGGGVTEKRRAQLQRPPL